MHNVKLASGWLLFFAQWSMALQLLGLKVSFSLFVAMELWGNLDEGTHWMKFVNFIKISFVFVALSLLFYQKATDKDNVLVLNKPVGKVNWWMACTCCKTSETHNCVSMWKTIKNVIGVLCLVNVLYPLVYWVVYRDFESPTTGCNLTSVRRSMQHGKYSLVAFLTMFTCVVSK